MVHDKGNGSLNGAGRRCEWKWYLLSTDINGIWTMGDVVLLPSGSVVIKGTSYADGLSIDHVFGQCKATRPSGFRKCLLIEDGVEKYFFAYLCNWYRGVPHYVDSREGTLSYELERSGGTIGLVLGLMALVCIFGACSGF